MRYTLTHPWAALMVAAAIGFSTLPSQADEYLEVVITRK